MTYCAAKFGDFVLQFVRKAETVEVCKYPIILLTYPMFLI